MNKEDLIEVIDMFVDKHQIIISNHYKKHDINAHFTTFGSRAALRAIREIVDSLSESEKEKVIQVMKNKRVNE